MGKLRANFITYEQILRKFYRTPENLLEGLPPIGIDVTAISFMTFTPFFGVNPPLTAFNSTYDIVFRWSFVPKFTLYFAGG